MSVIGFDIGNETCYTAVARAGGIEIIENEYSLRVTPLYVGFTEKSRDAGLAAKLKIIQNIDNTVFNFKTLLGKRFCDEHTQRELAYLPCEASELPSGVVGFNVKYMKEEVVFSVQQIMAIMLTKLKSVAEDKIGVRIQDCVISTAAYYSDRQRRALLDAAEIAGLKVLQLMNEATAAAMAYGFYRQEIFQTEAKIVVFVDMGHSALTVTACKFFQDKLSVLGSVCNTKTGGREFDSVLAKYFAEDFKNRYQIDVFSRKKALMSLLIECETLKKQMGMYSHELEITLENLMHDKDVKGKMKREFFENLSSSLLLNIEETMKDFFTQTNLNLQNVDEIQIIGGFSRFPALKNIIEKVFGKEPKATLNQDEAVAKGCSLQCALLSPTLRTKPFHVEDVILYAINFVYKVGNHKEEIQVFNRFQNIPSTKIITFSYKGPFTIEAIYSGISHAETEIGNYQFSDIPTDVEKLSEVKVKIKVSIDISGLLNLKSAKLVGKLANNSDENEISSQTTIIPYENPQPLDSMKSDEPSTNTESETILKQDEPCEDVEKSYELVITSFLPSLSKNDVAELIQKEQEMRKNDCLARRIADVRNEVEEYIYYTRGMLLDEMQAFVLEEDKSKFLEQVNGTEEWLYDSKDFLDEKEYLQRLDQLKVNFEPIFTAYSRLKEVTYRLSEFQGLLESSIPSIQSIIDSNNEKTTPNEMIEELNENWTRANEFFRKCLAQIDGIKFSDVLTLTPEMIQQEMKALQDKIGQVKSIRESNRCEPFEKTASSPMGDSKADASQTS